ncbi:MAG: carbohydrate binding family 9 domain-containing protein [Gemmatimonadota bacterium]|nr:carbohydrate binding family 9 domain-containing protein [Gemmatimonadota bacterium]MDE3214901.1 carbohydrate binding family 9 domain-containing protein [Gemmatimonadota bacterium]
MILALLGAFQVAAATPRVPQPLVFNGRLGQVDVRAPRLDATVTVDGVLDEPVWRRAAMLTGFSEYAPVDQRPSPDSTQVLVWYSRDAIYFGIKAFEPPDEVRATLAERDNVGSDDNTEILLDTYHERNRAYVFIVNPLGVQADGLKNEQGGYTPGSNVMPGQNDLTPDYIWQSKGHVTAWGYEVEVRIPFSSLRYPTAMPQSWGIQIQRNVQHNGYQETWTEARKASASFVAQEGTLAGLSGMHHGQVVTLNPELTNTTTGSPCCAPANAGWRYASRQNLGGNVRWAMGSNFVLNGTVKPDFSQVEADATQIAADERFALYYPEKRPFFVEGSDQFNVPNTLFYTRTIVQPSGAMKLTGKVGRTDVAVLSAVDAGALTPTGQAPLVNVLRLRQGFGAQSTVGMMYGDRVGGGRSNHVVDADLHWVFDPRTYAQFQAVMSSTTAGGSTQNAPMWEAVMDGTGRSFGFHYNVLGIGNGFADDNGFVQRTGIVQPGMSNRLSIYGAPGAFLERFNLMLQTSAVFRYDDFFAGKHLLEDKASPNMSFTLRGGWTVNVNPALGSYAFDPRAYGTDYVGTSAAAVPFVPAPRITTFTTQFKVATPFYKRYDASASVTTGHDVDFLETARVRRLDYNANLDLRPTEQLRVTATYQSSSFTRRSDGVRSYATSIPYLKVEYQLTRSIFFRVVAQYTSSTREPLIDWRTGQPIRYFNPSGGYLPYPAVVSNAMRADWLFSYRPIPGTVFYFGYGNTMTEPDALRFDQLRRTSDAFFIKGSYLFRALGGDGG